jgi:hypothetical protein
LPVFQTCSHDPFGVGIDAVSALALSEEGDDSGNSHPGLDAIPDAAFGNRTLARNIIFAATATP